MVQTSTCYAPSCRHTAEGQVAACPQCGGKMRTPRDIRRTGWQLLFLGIFVAIFIGAIAWSLAPALSQPGVEAADGNTFTGTPAQARMILTLLGATILLGLGFAINGAVQIMTGERKPLLIRATLAAAVALGVYALVANSML